MQQQRSGLSRWVKACLYLFGLPFVAFLLVMAAWACGLIHIQLFPVSL